MLSDGCSGLVCMLQVQVWCSSLGSGSVAPGSAGVGTIRPGIPS